MSKTRFVAKTANGYISKRGTNNPKIVKDIGDARIYLRAGDAWQMAKRWDKFYAPHQVEVSPIPIPSWVVEVTIHEGDRLADPRNTF